MQGLYREKFLWYVGPTNWDSFTQILLAGLNIRARQRWEANHGNRYHQPGNGASDQVV